MSTYKGRSARIVWNSGDYEVFGRVVEHTEVFVFESLWGDYGALDPDAPPTDMMVEMCGEDTIAFIRTEVLSRRGRMLLLAAPAQVRLEPLSEPWLRYCDMPCRLETSDLTPLVYNGRCVMISTQGLTHFSQEPIAADTAVTADIPLGRERLVLPGRVKLARLAGPSSHKVRVRFDDLDRLTVGRLRSLALSLG
jgi:hypothetical protein